MAGGAAMIGAMQALAQLKPGIPVTAFIPCVENMPGSRAQRPGDIVTALSGKTIEVINTDAEGRLILADALVYARRQGCSHLVDAATLTGAIVVALGHVRVGLFSNNDDLRDRVLAAAEREGERTWAMPLDEDYKDYLKSAFADLANVGGRWGGAVTAAMFLKEFAEDTPWVHLDIAGTAWIDDEKAHLAKGPSGLPMRTMVRPAGAPRDWDRFRALFIDGARLISMRVTADGPAPNSMTPDEFAKRSGTNSATNGFFESEITRRVETFGNIAHVFSTYESRRAAGDKPFARRDS